MEITVSSEQGQVPVKVFHLVGDLDAETFDKLQAEARKEIDAGTRHLVLDMSEVPYISSYGIRAISQVFNWLREASGDEPDAEISVGVRDGSFQSNHLKIACPNQRVLKVLTETGLDMYLQIDADLDKVVASFNK